MIEIDVLGCRSRKKYLIYQDAVNYFIHELMPNVKNMHIDLCIEKKLDADAFCTQIEPRYFIIEILSKLPFMEQIKALGHEVVHVRQFLRKQLDYRNGKVFWKNKPYDTKDLKRKNLFMEDYRQYYTSPWEVEAYDLEEKLYNNFILWYN